MRVLMINGDPGVSDPESAVAKRMEEYRRAFGELDILFCYGNIFNFIYGFFRGLKIIWHKKPDVITAQSPEHAAFAWIFSKIFRVPWQMQIHTDIFSPYFSAHSPVNALRVRIVKFLLPRTDGIRVVSENIKKSITDYNNSLSNRVAVLPVFVDIEKIKKTQVKTDLHKKYPGKFIILMASRITKEKNIGMAIKSLAEAKTQVLQDLAQHDGASRAIRQPASPELQRGEQANMRVLAKPGVETPLLLIVGDGPEKERLRLMAQGLGLKDSVVFEPAVDFETLISYYKTADLYLLTSFYEGWPLAPIEALASGLPVIVTDVVRGHETIKDGVNAVTVPVGDSRELALRISQLVANPEQLAKLKNGAENSFPAPLSKEKYLELYTGLLKNLAKPKVCYVLPLYEEGTDTHFFYNYLLIREVAKQLDVFVLIEKCPKCPKLSLGQVRHNLGITNCYIQKFKFPPLRFLEMLFICLRLRLSGYKNFYVHYSYYGALAARLATWRPGRQVRVFYWNRGMPWLFKRSWFEEKLLRFVLRHTILVTGPESLAKEYVARYGVKEYRVVSNWVDVERFAPDEKSKKNERLAVLPTAQVLQGQRTILFVHHLSKRKGADLIPEIAKGFGADVLFLVVGDGPEKGYLEQLPTAQVFQDFSQRDGARLSNSPAGEYAGLEKSGAEAIESAAIVLVGKIPNSEVVKYFHAADIFLMPSREEGSPRVILEAMASGTPFVASDIGGIRELVPESLVQFLCKPEDVKCFRDKIKMLLSDKTLYEKAEKDCIDYAQKFDIARGAEEFMNLFKKT
ncbi:MAG: glycosyltransferase family 4 protein [bacterium]|nr:glycosyltransferase family 4 protein [bacterium]